MNQRTISPKMFFLIVIVLSVLVYMKYDLNKEKANRQLLQEIMKKPIKQIERELNPEFVKQVTE
jgi:sensor domain CHASE-containing protein